MTLGLITNLVFIAGKYKFLLKVHQGEKEALALSLEYSESILLTDDGNAVKIARYLKKLFVISPLIVLDLYQLGKISYETAKKSVERLSIIGRYLPNLIADVFMMLESAKTEKERK
jgi:predicted nucleic acid-binding protein